MNTILIYTLISLINLLIIISLITYKKLEFKLNFKSNKTINVVVALTMIGLLTIIPFIYLIFNNAFWAEELKDKGEIGDFVGGLSSPIINLISAILVYYAFMEQKRANDLMQDSFNTKRNLYLNLQLDFYNRKKEECKYFGYEMNKIKQVLLNRTKTIDYKPNFYGLIYMGQTFQSFSEAIKLSDNNENYFTCFDKSEYPANRIVNLNEKINSLNFLNSKNPNEKDVLKVNDEDDSSEEYFESVYMPLAEELDRIIDLLEEIENECDKIIKMYT